jgi:hypothetical protein
MFTQPSTNQIASAYQGNPAPLARKVDQDKKQNGGIPKDLRQLMALNDIAQGKQASGIQQALQIPTNMPTVAQATQAQAQQAIQARLMQQAREQQRLQQKPPIVPPGTPQPDEQPQGIDSLTTNVGTQYAAEGGIIGFDGKTGSDVKDPNQKEKDEKALAAQREADRRGLLTIPAALLDILQLPVSAGYNLAADTGSAIESGLNRLGSAITGENINTQSDDQVGGKFRFSPTPFTDKLRQPTEREVKVAEQDRQKDTVLATDPSTIRSQLNAADSTQRAQPGTPVPPKVNLNTQTQNRVNTDSAPMPAGLQGLASSLATPGLDYQRKLLNQDENALMAAKKALYDKEVGARDLSIYDRTAAELQARKDKIKAPKPGFEGLMDYLDNIAEAGGKTWYDAGSKGASLQRQKSLAREAQQNELMDKILELGGKKSEAMFAEKKGMFDLTQGEKDRIIKEKSDAAKQLGLSEDKTRELIEQGLQKELDRKNEIRKAGIVAQDRDQLMNRAKALMAVDKTLGLEEAMKRASMAAGATSLESSRVRDVKGYTDAMEKINARYQYADNKSEYGKRQLAKKDQEIAEAKAIHGITDQGINTLATTQAAPLPAKSDLVVGKTYQTAKGPAKWNGTAFEQ